MQGPTWGAPTAAPRHDRPVRRLGVSVVAVGVGLVPLLGAAPAAASAPSIRGLILGADGRPVSTSLIVNVAHHYGFGDALGDLVSVPFEVLNESGCLAHFGGCKRAHQTTVRVGPDGRFALGAPDGPGDYDLSVLSDSAGQLRARVTTTVHVGSSGRTLPTLQVWTPQIALAAPGPSTVDMSWQPLPVDGGDIGPVSYRVDLKPIRPTGFYPLARVAGTTATIDARDIEDTSGQATVVARGRVAGITVEWLALPVAYPAPAGRPLSRGRVCRLTFLGLTTGRWAPCWLDNGTSGDSYNGTRSAVCYRDTPPPDLECARRPITAVTIDLAAPRSVAEVRQLSCARCLIDVSVDGVRWSAPIATTDAPNAVVELPAATVVRYVRLRAMAPVVPALDPDLESGPVIGKVVYDVTPNDLALQGEMSVWGPAASAASTPTKGEPLPSNPANPESAKAHATRKSAPWLIAGSVLAVGIAAALALTASTRRQRGARTP